MQAVWNASNSSQRLQIQALKLNIRSENIRAVPFVGELGY